MTRDPNSYIAASAEHLAETLTKKNADYAPTGEFSNFEAAAKAASITVMQLITAQIAIKLTRIEKLLQGTAASNEPLEDSFLDLAGYAAIGHARLRYESTQREMEPPKPTPIENREEIRNSADDEHAHGHIWINVGDYDECQFGTCFAKRDKKGYVYE